MGFDETFKEHLKILNSSMVDFKPEDINVKSLARDDVGEFWTGAFKYVMEKDDFSKKENERIKKEIELLGEEQAIKNSLERYDQHLKSIFEEFQKKNLETS